MPAGAPPPDGSPLLESRRIAELDALRGLAVAGIALMNVFVFAMPAQAYYNPLAWGGDGPLQLAAWAASFVLVEDKFRNIFAMMFGAGVAILFARGARARGHLARMAVLFAIGFVHATLLFGGDVLRLYALCGVVLPFVLGWSERRLWQAAAAMMALHLAVGGYVAWGWIEYWWRFAGAPGADPAPLLPAEQAFGADPEAIRFQIERGMESFGERIGRRLANPLGPLLAAAALLPATLAAMLAGIALWRGGLLKGEWAPERAFRLARRLAPLGMLPLTLLAAWTFAADFHGVVVGANALVLSAPFDLVLGVAWAALAMGLFVKSGERAAWVRRLAAAGRMALTNYLATSVVLAAIYASWGLGLFGETGRLATYAVATVPIALMLAWSPPWLARFRQGPAEWAWRSLAQGRALPLRR